MKKLVVLGIMISTMMSIGGCTVATINGKGTVPVMLNQSDRKVKIVKEFKESKMRVFDLTGNFDITDLTNKVVSETNADTLSNVQLRLNYGIPEYLLNLCTLGFANAMTVEVSGEAVKYEEEKEKEVLGK